MSANAIVMTARFQRDRRSDGRLITIAATTAAAMAGTKVATTDQP